MTKRQLAQERMAKQAVRNTVQYQRMMRKESMEHPSFSPKQVNRIVLDHMRIMKRARA